MKVILMSDLRARGRRGQVVEVKPGFARNFLLPQGLALVATEGNLKKFEQEKKKIHAKNDAARDSAAAIAAKIGDVKLEIPKRAQENGALYGSVTPGEIVTALAERGVDVDRRQIDLAGGIKTVGEHLVRVDLHAEVVAELTVTVTAAE
jgi:large subunit ribosomal protein L9